jgi:thiamine pyrophosphokinase
MGVIIQESIGDFDSVSFEVDDDGVAVDHSLDYR